MTKRLLDSLIKACHNLFEEGYLSHQRVDNLNSPVIYNIQKEMEFFEVWCHRHQQAVYKQHEEKQGKRNFLQFWQVGLQKLIKV